MLSGVVQTYQAMDFYLCCNYRMTYIAIRMQYFVSWYDISIIFQFTCTEHIMCREQSHQVFLNLASRSTVPCPKWLDSTWKCPSIYVKLNIDTLSAHGADAQKQTSTTNNYIHLHWYCLRSMWMILEWIAICSLLVMAIMHAWPGRVIGTNYSAYFITLGYYILFANCMWGVCCHAINGLSV